MGGGSNGKGGWGQWRAGGRVNHNQGCDAMMVITATIEYTSVRPGVLIKPEQNEPRTTTMTTLMLTPACNV